VIAGQDGTVDEDGLGTNLHQDRLVCQGPSNLQHVLSHAGLGHRDLGGLDLDGFVGRADLGEARCE